MAVLPTNALTLADLASRMDAKGNIGDIINVMSQNNEILEDMLWVEGNLPTGHKTTQVVGVPQAAWRLLNYGVPYVRGQTAPITDTTGMLEAYSRTDKMLVDLSGNPKAFRFGEETLIMQGISQQMAQAVFYGNTQTNPAQFIGLSPRYSTVNVSAAPNAANVIDAGGTGTDNTSIWLVCWGQNSVTGIYPKGSRAGLFAEDVTTAAPVYDPNGLPYQAYQTHFKWDCGLSVRDWRYIVRIANIDVSDMRAGTGTSLVDAMIQAVGLIPTMPASASAVQGTAGGGGGAGLPLGGNRAAFYMNRTVRSFMQIQQRKDPRAFLAIDNIAGRPVTSFLGVPVRGTDALLNTEARVV